MITTEKEFIIKNTHGIMRKEADKYINYTEIGNIRNEHKHKQTCAKNRKKRKKMRRK